MAPFGENGGSGGKSLAGNLRLRPNGSGAAGPPSKVRRAENDGEEGGPRSHAKGSGQLVLPGRGGGAIVKKPPKPMQESDGEEDHGALPAQGEMAKDLPSPSEDDGTAYIEFLKMLKRYPYTTEFAYLRRKQEDDTTYNPYLLEMVPFSQVDRNDFYTMSSHGVSHCEGGATTDFTSLDQWEREFHLFHALKQLQIFRHYRSWKGLNIWKRAVRRTKIQRAKKHLAKYLFTVNTSFQQPITMIRNVCFELSGTRLHKLISGRQYTMEEFADSHEEQRHKAISELSSFSESARRIARKACKDVMQKLEEQLTAFQEPGRMSAQALGDAGQGRHRGNASEHSVSSRRSSNTLSYTMAAAKRSEQRRLVALVRMLDYMISDALHQVLVETLKEVWSLLQKAEPIFLVDILYEEQGLVLEPTSISFQRKVESILNSFMETLASVPRLLGHGDLNEFLESSEIDSLAPFSALIDDEEYENVLKSLKDSFSDAFSAAEEHKANFKHFHEMITENNALDIESFKTAYEEGQRTLAHFRQDMEKFRDQIEQIQNLPENNDVSIIRISASRLKEQLLPSARNCLEALHELLPRIGAEKYKSFIDEVHNARTKLSARLNTVEDFVNQLSFLDHVKERRQDLEDTEQEIHNIYDLINEFEIPVNEFEYAQYQTMRQDFNEMKNVMEDADAAREDNIKKFSNELQNQVDNLGREVSNLLFEAQDEDFLSKESDPDRTISKAETLEGKVAKLREESERIRKFQQLFKVQESRFEELEELEEEVSLKKSLWTGKKEFERLTEDWTSTHFEQIDVDAMDEKVQRYNKLVMKLERGLPKNDVVPEFKEYVEGFKRLLPVVRALRNKAMQKRHWERVQEVLGQIVENNENFTLQSIIDLGAPEYKDDINQISTEATQEQALQDMLSKVQEKWNEIELTIVPYKEGKDTYILSGVDDIQAALDESMVTMTTIMSSRFVAGIREEVNKVEKQLNMFSDTLEEWLKCQKNWLYLESIFSAPDIPKQLPQASRQFDLVDKQYKEIMRRTKETPNALRAGTSQANLTAFQRANETLEKVQKELEEYLEQKRVAFPRFYFLSNDELLEILAETRNVQAVQPHMSKCFDGINRLDFGSDPKSIDIYAMISAEGERVDMPRNLKARGNVESWLSDVEKGMVNSLKRLTKEAHNSYSETPRTEWVLQQPAQIVILISQIYWGKGVTASLQSDDPHSELSSFLETNKEQLRNLTVLVRSDLSELKRKTIVALITIDVHQRDIVEELIRNNVQSTNDFHWQMQLRFYWDGEQDIAEARQTTWHFPYGYEYLGAQPRLVVTPMTDRCYLTLTGAMSLNLGGAPQGPAGTGKTETTKDLGKAVGIQCVVFNCSENLDYKFMAKFFSGLAQCGAWACFDEFNRIDVEVLSVVAQQLRTILTGLKAGRETINFEGQDIKLVHSVGVFITMNPGYAGRTELPDNLKALFRPMAMMIPDYALVAEVMLFAEGFETSKELSRKMVKLYKLSSEQLSQQDHYDFGMRALKSVLVMAGSLKRASPDEDEQEVLIRAMCDSNLPKFLKEDAELFLAIVRDLFPDKEIKEKEFADLQNKLQKTLSEQRLQIVPAFETKALQLFETMNVRFGVMIVGPTGSGKSTLYGMLRSAMTKLREEGHSDERFQQVRTYPLNPKCISMGELYGEYNLLTNEWRDGLASTLIRDAVNDTSPDHKWTVFDGPVDALWIESMNTVLDDNCTLCLPNGERIKLNPNNMRMLFEVEDLAYASPATISRCGMVYMPSENVGWLPLIRTWAETSLNESMSEEVREHLISLIETHTGSALEFVRKHCHEYIASVDANLVKSLCTIVQSLCLPERGRIDYDNMDASTIMARIDKIFLFALVWSVGGNLASNYWEAFDNFVRENLAGAVGVCFPPRGLVYDYYVDVKDNVFKQWSDIVPEFKYDRNKPFFEMIVPNVDTTRFSSLFELCLDVEKPVFFTGSTGVGKSIIAQDFLSRKAETAGISPVFVNFSAQTSSMDTQQLIESKLEKQRKTRLGPPPGGHVVIFVDDVNMPARERYGAQPPIELLRLFLDYGGFYDRDKLFWKDIVNTTVTSACAPPGGGRQQVTPRFFRHFNMLSVPSPSDHVLRRILSSILGGFLADFPESVAGTLHAVVNSSIELYRKSCTDLLPTPAKAHYLFNTRDLSNVLQGILMIKPSSCPNEDSMKRLWVHESTRVFCDRLVTEDDREYFKQTVSELVGRHFSGGSSYNELFVDRHILFGDFMKMGVEKEERRYEEISDMNKLTRTLEAYLEEYNLVSRSPMNLVFFMDAAEHTARIARILRQPRGNAMLVGVGGSGKQSLTLFASFIAGFEVYQIELSRDYGSASFREDLKNVYKQAGIQGKETTFLFTDSQIVDESFLEDINNLLNSGEIPGLFQPDEREQIHSDMIPYAQQHNIPQSKDAIYKAFINRVRDNLHVILCMSPVGSSFRIRCRQFPSLINCCTINWFTEWPEAALHSVAKRFLGEEDLGSEEVMASLCNMCVNIHNSVKKASQRMYEELRRPYYTTPKSYLDLINLYSKLLAEKREEVNNNRDKLLNGLKKLNETNSMVETMKQELRELQPQLEQKKEDTAKLIEQVDQDQQEAERVRENVAKEQEEVKKQQEETQEIKDEAEADLNQAIPALEEANQSLDSLNSQDITEVKSFPRPPELVAKTMNAVCLLLGEKQDWDTAKKVLSDNYFLRRLKNFGSNMSQNNEPIPDKTINSLKRYTDDPNFNPPKVAEKSNAAKSLCMWVIAAKKVSETLKVVNPKRKKLESARANLEEANAKLNEKQEELRQVEERVEDLQSRLQTARDEQQKVQEQADLTEKRLERAGKLMSGLADENERWKETTEELRKQAELLVGDVFISSACISYIGAFPGELRDELVLQWITKCQEYKIPVSDGCSLSGTLASPVEVRDWNLWGLPTDRVSVDNGVMATRGRRWPLMIDPQGQANSWVKNMEAKSGLKTLKLTDSHYQNTLENSIRVGTPVLVEDVGESLDPALDPILQGAIFTSGGGQMLRMGDKDVDYDPKFRLYITTKLANPHYLPDVCIKVTLINFTVTLSGLEDQLLGEVVRKELPDVEQKRDNLVLSLSSDKKQLKDLEDKILKLLRESEGNILDDENLINTLNNSKLTSGMIQERVKETEETERQINEMREEYRPAAKRGSILYFVIADLSLVSPMYQYSLRYFMNLFNYCVDNSEAAHDGQITTRLNNLMPFTTNFIFTSVSRGLFEEHKVLFSFLLATSIKRGDGEISSEDWSFFIRGATRLKETADHHNPAPETISQTAWKQIEFLDGNVPAFDGIVEDMSNNAEEWCRWIQSRQPQDEELPCGWGERLSDFQHILPVRVFRDEKVLQAMQGYVSRTLGTEFTSPPPWTLESVYKDTDCQTPIIFILSQGADPTEMLQRFAEKKGWSPGERLHMVSLGQGQGPVAENAISYAQRNGDWVCLQNCHLASSWMVRLRSIVDEMTTAERSTGEGGLDSGFSAGVQIHPDFRLWLTSMPSDTFPAPVLQNGIKLTNEPPKGVKANTYRTFNELSSEEYASYSTSQRKLLFSLSMFHAIVQERRKFGPLGFNIPYEFSNSDLECSQQTLKMYLKQHEGSGVPWYALLYIIGQINYGGRVTDDIDRRCLMSILKQYLRKDVLNDGYSYDSNGIYKPPPASASLEEVLSHISSTFPASEPPNVFGMHENADISLQLQESRSMLDTVLSIQPRATGSSQGQSPDVLVDTSAAEIEAGLQEPFLTSEDAVKGLFDRDREGNLKSLSVVLSQEMERFNRLTEVLVSSLKELRKAVKGLAVLSDDLEAMYNAILNNQVPALWSRVAYPSLKPLASWIQDYHARISFFRAWLREGTPRSFWLPGFFFPQGFLTGLLQTHARKYRIPIDSLNFMFDVLPNADGPGDLSHPASDGVYVHGLFIDGARWNKEGNYLDDAEPGVMYTSMPVVHFRPVQDHQPPELLDDATWEEYQCPLYKTPERAGTLSTTGQSTNFIICMGIPTKPGTTSDYWVLQGVACICATRE